MTMMVTDDNTATPLGPGAADDAVERALAAAVQDPSTVGDLLTELSRGRLWVPLPDDGRPVTDGSAVTLPTVTYLGSEFVPAFTSAQRLAQSMTGAAEGEEALAPHVVVRAADLARLLPPGLGIALNPGAGPSVPVYPEGVAGLASADPAQVSSRISVGPLPAQPDALLAGIRFGLADVSAASQAAAAWLSVEQAGEGLIISVALDDPNDPAAQEAVVRVVQRAATGAPQDSGFPIDVTFPGEGEPDPVDEWISAFATPFYLRG